VLKAGGSLGLSPEALHKARILGEAPVQQFQRDLAPELLVLGQIYVGHSSGPQA
jgi:hypothetical protein